MICDMELTDLGNKLSAYGFKVHSIEINRNFNLIKTIKSFSQITFLIKVKLKNYLQKY